MTLRTFSPKTTKKIAALLAEELLKRETSEKATVIALVGNLGSGKTTFIQGFARGLGLKRRLTSPTFLVLRRYGFSNRRSIFHIDAYRIKDPNELRILGFDEVL